MRRRLIVDVETTGLDPELHEIWELAVIELPLPGVTEATTEYLWRIKPDLTAADPGALQVGRFYERTRHMPVSSRDGVYNLARPPFMDCPSWSAPGPLALAIARLLDGATLIAANPAFDAGFLAQLLRDNKQAPAWHYRLRDIGSMAHGYLNGLGNRRAGPPADASTDDFARALGVDPDRFERHSALGDCRLVLAMLDVITGGA